MYSKTVTLVLVSFLTLGLLFGSYFQADVIAKKHGSSPSSSSSSSNSGGGGSGSSSGSVGTTSDSSPSSGSQQSQQPQTLQSNNGNGPTTASGGSNSQNQNNQNQQGSVDCKDPMLLLGYGTPSQLALFKALCNSATQQSQPQTGPSGTTENNPPMGITSNNNPPSTTENNPQSTTNSGTSGGSQTGTGDQNQPSGSSSPPVTDLTPHPSPAPPPPPPPPSSSDCSSSISGVSGCGKTTTTNADGSITAEGGDPTKGTHYTSTAWPSPFPIKWETHWQNGDIITQNRDGSSIIKEAAGKTTIYNGHGTTTFIDKDGHWYVEFPPNPHDNSQSYYYENGTTLTAYQGGRIIIRH